MSKIFDAVSRAMKDFDLKSDGTVAAGFVFPPDSIVFGGHFPGNPILPGICQLEAIKAILEKTVGKAVRLTAVKSAKFFKPLQPGNYARFEMEKVDLNDKTIKLKVKVSSSESRISEFKATYVLDSSAEGNCDEKP
ncbi:MAG: hypothetical protein A2020_15085 [Lentisphaerae bacterium GWF2_45_14]|nr:MAG: hypothetical protein A2020_15085 [Lentisphaerae bacterium GWF2_45_14]